MKLYREDVIKLTGPILMEQLFVTLMGIINTMMAGHIGKEAVSAIGMIDSINNLFIAFFSALAVGGTVVVSQYIGQDNIKKANEATKQALYTSILISLSISVLMAVLRTPIITGLFGSAEQKVINNAYVYFGITLLTYPLITIDLISNGILRGAGDSKTPMQISIFMNILNVAFTYLFIHGFNLAGIIKLPALGVMGAALGISVARAIGAVIIVIVLLRGSKVIKLKRMRKFKFDKDLLKPIFGIGVPASIESLMFNGGKLIMQIFIVGMGTAAIAANTISNSITTFFNISGNSLAIAATALVGRYMGRDDPDEASRCLSYIVKLSTSMLVIVGCISIIFSTHLGSLFTNNKGIINIVSGILKSYGIAIVTWPISFVLPSGLKGAGDVKYTLATSLIGMWIFRMAFGYILGISLHFGLLGIWIGMYVDWLIRGILYLIRFKKGKWKNHIVIKRVSA